MSAARIGVVDDEPRAAQMLAMVLGRDGHDVTAFDGGAAFLAAHARRPFDLLLTDLEMPGMSGVELLRAALEVTPELPVILVTAYATVGTAVEAMRDGAFDFLEKPYDNAACRARVARALELTRLSRENRALRAALRARYGLDRMVVASDAMDAVLDLAKRAARSHATVLITGESGTGKELLAKAIHVHSDRVAGPFVAVNCKAFAAGVVESELFGHEKGAFTGAERSRPGVFERADGGTVFLDEIGEVGHDFQAKLLRVLQEREVQRVGGDAPRPVDVRVVTATNRDLQAEIAEGRFREDLYFRLAVIPLHLPPLRERPADVLPLARAFLGRLNREHRRALAGWTDEVERWLVAHDWPGNVRELENTLERGVVLARGERIELADLVLGGAAGGGRDTAAPTTLQGHLDAAAAQHIRAALAAAGGVRVEAARLLGVERTTLYRLMQKYDVEG